MIRVALLFARAPALSMALAHPASADSEMHQSPLLERTFPEAYPAEQDLSATRNVRVGRRAREEPPRLSGRGDTAGAEGLPRGGAAVPPDDLAGASPPAHSK